MKYTKQDLVERLDAIRDQLTRMEECAMATGKDLKDDLTRITAAVGLVGTEVAAVATDLKSLKDQIAVGLTQAEVDAIHAQMGDTASALESTSADLKKLADDFAPPDTGGGTR